MVLFRHFEALGEGVMAPTHYKFYDAEDGISPGCTSPVTVSAYAKKSYRDKAFLVPNEYICNQLAQFLGLPVPVGYLVNHKGEVYFCSGHAFGDTIERPPLRRSQSQEIIENRPHEAAGCLAFDCWIANEDRNAGNIVCEDIFQGTEFRMIDHGEALFVGSNTVRAMERLDGIHKDNKDCLCDHVFVAGRELRHELNDWVERIQSLPEFQIMNACFNAVGSGHNGAFTDRDAHLCANYLLARRKTLKVMLVGSDYKSLLTSSDQPSADMEDA